MDRYDTVILQAIPQPALVVERRKILELNDAARALFPGLMPGDVVPEDLPLSPGAQGALRAGEREWLATCTQAGTRQLVLLRPMPDEEIAAPQLEGAVRCLREQLGSLMLSSQLLARSGKRLDEKKWEHRLAALDRTSCQMLRLVDHLDLLRELETGRLPFLPAPLDLAGLCRELADAAIPLLQEGGYLLVADLVPASVLVNGESKLLQILILQLVTNAVRAAGKSGKVTLGLERRGRRVILTVEDTGEEDALLPPAGMLIGIPDAERIARPGEGAGVGLALARRIAALHGGTMVMERQRDRGIRVTLSMPLAEDTAALPVREPGPEYAGGLSPLLVELSELLPIELYTAQDLEEAAQ